MNLIKKISVKQVDRFSCVISKSLTMNEKKDNDVTVPLTTQVNNPQILNNKVHKIINEYEFKKYKKRWLMLSLFCFYCALSTYQWVEYSIIANIVTR